MQTLSLLDFFFIRDVLAGPVPARYIPVTLNVVILSVSSSPADVYYGLTPK